MGKLSQAIAHGATLLQVDGNFDDCLTLARKLAEAYPVELVNSVNPARIEGQKTAAFEVVDALGDAPDIHCLPVGNAGNITAYWQGYREYCADAAQPGPATQLPRMWGFQAAGAAPIVLGPPGRPPRHHRHRDPDRQPRLLGAGRAGPRRVRRPDRRGHRRADPGRAPAAVRAARASSSSRRPRPPSPGCSQAAAAGLVPAGARVVCTVTGHGLKDPQWALQGRRRRRGRARPGAGRRLHRGRGPSGSRADRGAALARRLGTGRRSRCACPASSANLGPGFDSLGLALGIWDDLPSCRVTERPGLEIVRRGRGRPATCRATSGTWSSARCCAAWAALGVHPPGGLHLVCRNTVPHGRGLGSSAAAIVAGIVAAQALHDAAPHGPTTTGRRRPRFANDLASAARGPPRQRLGQRLRRPHGRPGPTTTGPGRAHTVQPGRAPRRARRSCSCPATQLSTADGAGGAARRTCRTRDAALNSGRAALLVAGADRGARTCCCRPPGSGCTRSRGGRPSRDDGARRPAAGERSRAPWSPAPGPSVLVLATRGRASRRSPGPRAARRVWQRRCEPGMPVAGRSPASRRADTGRSSRRMTAERSVRHRIGCD